MTPAPAAPRRADRSTRIPRFPAIPPKRRGARCRCHWRRSSRTRRDAGGARRAGARRGARRRLRPRPRTHGSPRRRPRRTRVRPSSPPPREARDRGEPASRRPFSWGPGPWDDCDGGGPPGRSRRCTRRHDKVGKAREPRLLQIEPRGGRREIVGGIGRNVLQRSIPRNSRRSFESSPPSKSRTVPIPSKMETSSRVTARSGVRSFQIAAESGEKAASQSPSSTARSKTSVLPNEMIRAPRWRARAARPATGRELGCRRSRPRE